MKQEHEDLIQRHLDGCLEADELDRLRQALERDPDVRRTQEQLEQLVGMLDRVEEVEPPKTLRSEILAAVARVPRAEVPLFRRMLAGLGIEGGAWLPRAAVLVGAGAVAGLLIFSFMPGDYAPPGGSGLTGTLGPSSPVQPPLGEVRIEEDWLEGRIGSAGTAGQPEISIETATAEPVRVVIAYDPEVLRLAVVREQSGDVERFEQEIGELSWHTRGRTGRALSFERVAPGRTALNFGFFGSGGRVHRAMVPIPEPSTRKN